MVETGLQRWYIIIKKLKAGWQWTGGKKAYGNNDYQKAAALFAQSAECFPDWGMTNFWRLRAAIQTRNLKQAQLHLIKCRETLPQLEEVLNRWETLLEHLVEDNELTTDELAELDTYTDEQLQRKWEKPQWSWKSASIVTIVALVTDLVVATGITVFFDLPSHLITENIVAMLLVWWWWNYRRKRVPYSEPFMVWFFIGTRICANICKNSRPFHVYLVFSIIGTLVYILVCTAFSNYEPGKKIFGWYSHETPIYPIWYLMRIALTTPLIEEIIFRETLFSFFGEKWKRKIVYLVITALFTLAHIDYILEGNVKALINVLILSLINTWFYEKYRHLFAAVLIHGLNNGLAVLEQMIVWYLIYSKVH